MLVPLGLDSLPSSGLSKGLTVGQLKLSRRWSKQMTLLNIKVNVLQSGSNK